MVLGAPIVWRPAACSRHAPYLADALWEPIQVAGPWPKPAGYVSPPAAVVEAEADILEVAVVLMLMVAVAVAAHTMQVPIKII